MTYNEEHLALAAEYALGTLDAEERSQVETMMAIDKDYMAIVEAWGYRLGALNQMVGSVEPRPEVWDRIKAAVGVLQPQAPIALPELPPVAQGSDAPAQVTEVPAQVSDAPGVVSYPIDGSGIRLSGQLRRWRSVAALAGAIAIALIAMIAILASRPELLPDRFRPKPKVEVVEVKAPRTAPSPQYVAMLQKDGDSPGFVLTVDSATRNFSVRRVGAQAEPGKSFELWLVSERLPKPRSLGIINGDDFTARQVLSSYAPDIINSATYTVTVEQEGGSPDGNPHTAPVFAGKLIEVVTPR